MYIEKSGAVPHVSGEDSQLFWIKNRNQDQRTLCHGENMKVIKRKVSGKPLLTDGRLLYYREAEILFLRSLQQANTEDYEFKCSFKPHQVIRIKNLSTETRTLDLVVGKGKPEDSFLMLVTQTMQNGTISRQLAPISSLQEIFRKYRRVKMVKEFNIRATNTQLFVFQVFSSQSGQYSLVTCNFTEGDEGVQKFKLLDTYSLKKSHVLNSFYLSPIDRINTKENPILALIAYNGSSLMEVTIGGNQAVASRLSAKIKHSFNFNMKVTQAFCLQEHKKVYLIRDESNNIYAFRSFPDDGHFSNLKDQTLNLFQGDSSQKCTKIVSIENKGIYFLMNKPSEPNRLSLCQLQGLSPIDTVKQLLYDKKILKAHKVVELLGKRSGEILLWEHHLQNQQYRDPNLLGMYLMSMQDDNQVDKIMEILKTQVVGSVDSLRLFVDTCVKLIRRKQEDTSLDNQTLLFRGHKRLKVFIKANPSWVDGKTAQKFIFSNDFIGDVVNPLLYDYESSPISERLRMIFEDLQVEFIKHYKEVFSLIPLELVHPSELMPFLPPGKQTGSKLSKYWLKVQKLYGKQQSNLFEKKFLLDQDHIFETIAIEYLLDLHLPGRALLLLTEAVQRRQIWSKNITQFALEACEQTLFQSLKKDDTQKLPVSRIKRCKVLFGDNQNNFEGVQNYFEQTKWLLALDSTQGSRIMYDRYLQELKEFIQVEELELDMLLKAHANPKLIALTEADLAQVVLDIVYVERKTSDQYELSRIYDTLSEMNISENQRTFLKEYFHNHLIIADEMTNGLLQINDQDIRLKTLLRWQMEPQDPKHIQEVKQVVGEFFDFLVARTQDGSHGNTRKRDRLKNAAKSALKTGLSFIESLTKKEEDFDDDENTLKPLTAAEIATRWADIYQSLYKFTSAIGFMKESQQNIDEEQSESLSGFVLQKLFGEKPIQVEVITQLIQFALNQADDKDKQSGESVPAYIPLGKLFEQVRVYISNAYQRQKGIPNEEDWQEFFNEFSDNAKTMLKLFVDESVTVNVQKEAILEHKLIKCMAILYSDSLLHRTPFKSIRDCVLEAPESINLVQYVLKHEGLANYPDNFESLCQINTTISSGEQNAFDSAIIVLTWLETNNQLESKQQAIQNCPYVLQLIEEHIVPHCKGSIQENLAAQLIKILRMAQEQDETSSKFKWNTQLLLSFLMSKVSKSSPEFTKLCDLRHQNESQDTQSYLEYLQAAVNDDQPNRAQFYWRKMQVPITEVIKEMSFTNKQALKRFFTLTESIDCLQRYIELKETLGTKKFKNQISIEEVIEMCVFDSQSLENYIKEQQEEQKFQKQGLPNKQDQNAIQKVVFCTDVTELKDLLLIEYGCGQNQDQLNVFKIRQDMTKYQVSFLGHLASKVILETYKSQLKKEISPSLYFLAGLIEQNPSLDLNILVFLQQPEGVETASQTYDHAELGVLFPIHMYASDDWLTLAAELKRVVNDTNILSLVYTFDDSGNQGGAVLICVLHYITKLESFVYMLQQNKELNTSNIEAISAQIYQHISKDSMQSLLEVTEDEKAEVALTYINEQFEQMVSELQIDLQMIQDEIMINIQ